MALKGLSLIENFSWYSPRDTAPNEADKTKFVLGAVDVMVRSHIQDNATAWHQAEGGMQLINKTATRNFEIVRFGLKEIENFKNDQGGDIKIKFVDRVLNGKVYKVVHDDILNMIDGRDIAEMAEAIIEANSPTEDTRKK